MLLAKDRPGESLEWCRRAASLNPRQPKYAYTLAFFQDQQGQTTAAAGTLEKLVETQLAGADAYTLLGRIYEDQHQPAKALSVYQRAVENPKLPREERAQFEARLTGQDASH